MLLGALAGAPEVDAALAASGLVSAPQPAWCMRTRNRAAAAANAVAACLSCAVAMRLQLGALVALMAVQRGDDEFVLQATWAVRRALATPASRAELLQHPQVRTPTTDSSAMVLRPPACSAATACSPACCHTMHTRHAAALLLRCLPSRTAR